MITVHIVGWFALIALSCSLAAFAFFVFSGKRKDSESLGLRGLKRKEVLSAGGWFYFVHPVIARLASFMRYIGLPSVRAQIDSSIKQSGYFLGLSTDEFFAITLLCAALGGVVGTFVVQFLAYPSFLAIFFFALGAFIPYARIRNEIEKRMSSINRALPGAIDLLSLCIGAGLDFPGAVAQLLKRSSADKDPLEQEMSWLLQELDLGFTRRQALLNFSERSPTRSVQEFVSAVVQSEARGTPLTEVLTIQANSARLARSMRAEELASRAGILMLGPLALMMLSIMLLLMGPFALGYGF
ncbi:MAG: type II secretion system F family protein [Myxococcales bacterium]|nr:MAG: type II secretion system F family protein [Myxococcales bacterium]